MNGTPVLAMSIEFTLNGKPTSLDIHPAERLLDTLRYALRLTGTKEGCGEGECGACTVLLDGLPANACLIPTYQIRGRDIRTIESVETGGLGALKRGGATQCGACTPGVVMAASWIRRHPDLIRDLPIRTLMAGNLCRCTGYTPIIDAVIAASVEG